MLRLALAKEFTVSMASIMHNLRGILTNLDHSSSYLFFCLSQLKFPNKLSRIDFPEYKQRAMRRMQYTPMVTNVAFLFSMGIISDCSFK